MATVPRRDFCCVLSHLSLRSASVLRYCIPYVPTIYTGAPSLAPARYEEAKASRKRAKQRSKTRARLAQSATSPAAESGAHRVMPTASPRHPYPIGRPPVVARSLCLWHPLIISSLWPAGLGRLLCHPKKKHCLRRRRGRLSATATDDRRTGGRRASASLAGRGASLLVALAGHWAISAAAGAELCDSAANMSSSLPTLDTTSAGNLHLTGRPRMGWLPTSPAGQWTRAAECQRAGVPPLVCSPPPLL